MAATPSWRMLLAQEVAWALDLAAASAGSSIPAKIPMMAMTTKSSINVNAPRRAGLQPEII